MHLNYNWESIRLIKRDDFKLVTMIFINDKYFKLDFNCPALRNAVRNIIIHLEKTWNHECLFVNMIQGFIVTTLLVQKIINSKSWNLRLQPILYTQNISR